MERYQLREVPDTDEAKAAAITFADTWGDLPTDLRNAAIEALTRTLAGEYGRSGVRVVGLRSNFTPETYPGVTDEMLAPLIRDALLGRLPRLAELAGTAAYLASDRAGAMTGGMVNLTCGAIID